MRAKDFIVEAFDVGFITNYIKKHHDENLHPDFLENLNSFTSFELKKCSGGLNQIRTIWIR